MSYTYGIPPSFSDDESELPPPPPEINFRNTKQFYTDDILTDLELNEHKLNEQEKDEFEHTLSEHEFKADLYGDEYPPSIASTGIQSELELEDNSKRSERTLAKKKNHLICLSSVILMLIVLSIGLSALSMNKSEARDTQVSAAIESSTALLASNATDADNATNATEAPIANATEAPIVNTTAPTEAPTLAPTECVDEVKLSKECYAAGEDIDVIYNYCSPHEKAWLGIYRAGSAGLDGRMNQRSIYWELPCGGKNSSCPTPMGNGNTTMYPTLGVGRYQVYEISSMERPYISVTASQPFNVRRNCDEPGATNHGALEPAHRN